MTFRTGSLFRFLSAAIIFLAVLALGACGGGGSSSSDGGGGSGGGSGGGNGGGDTFDFEAMFTNLADNVIIPNYSAFKTATESLAMPGSELDLYCDAIGTGEEAQRLSDAREEWRSLMLLWQRAELHTLGPAADEANLLRNQIYAYDEQPFDSCRTDRAVVLAEDSGFDISTRVFSSRGLDALEYLLFQENLNHTCTSSNPQTDPWDARTEMERKQARCAYAQLAVDDILEAASAIEEGWLASGDNYRAVFIASDSSTQALILESISDALFYIEKDTKDAKLGAPTALKEDQCDAVACPDAVESPYSGHALQNIRANLQSFVSIFTGADDESFDDIITEADMAAINTAFLDDANAAIDLATSLIDDGDDLSVLTQAIIDSDLTAECENSNANPADAPSVEICALHGYVKRITDRLRTDFVTIVGVDLPDRVQGDTD